MSKLNDEQLNVLREQFEKRNCELLKFVNKTVKLEYLCKCGIVKTKLYKDFMRNKTCRTCTVKSLSEKPNYDLPTSENGEIWKAVIGGWVSNYGNAKNSIEKDLTLCPTKFRYHIGGKNQYISILIAKAFEIENYDKLDSISFVVSHIDKDITNNVLDNLKIVSKTEIGKDNGKKSRQSETFKDKILWVEDKYKDIEHITITILPKHKIYKNGEIYNGKNFLSFTKSDNYFTFYSNSKGYKVHRLVCFAFHPLKNKENLSDYDGIQVNHKDGNTLNNNADNLEWVTPSENMKHSYKKKLNNKVRNVLQYNLECEFMREYISIAEASRETGEPEHRIRSIAQGKKNSKAQFFWMFKNEEETEEYSKKYSSK